jgi:hypothetical protein
LDNADSSLDQFNPRDEEDDSDDESEPGRVTSVLERRNHLVQEGNKNNNSSAFSQRIVDMVPLTGKKFLKFQLLDTLEKTLLTT